MMKIKVRLSIGYPTATHDDIIHIAEDEFEGMTEEQKDEALFCYANEWAQNYIELGYDVIEEEAP